MALECLRRLMKKCPESQKASPKKGIHFKESFPITLVLGVKNTVEIETALVSECGNCGEDLSAIEASSKERRTLIDIFFEKRTTHIDAETKNCPSCHVSTKGSFPKKFAGPLQYGRGVKVFVLNLLIAQMVSINRIQKMVQAIIGKAISEATIMRYVLRVYCALEKWEKEKVRELLDSRVINTDETSMKVNKKNHWIHVYSSGDITLKFIHPKRGNDAIKDIGIIPKYNGVIVHDCWTSYLSYQNCDHGLCGSHLLRELAFIIESNSYKWASNMKKLLQQTADTIVKRKRKKLTPKEYASLQRNYRNILTRGEKEIPKIPTKKKSRGKVAKSTAHNLLERLKKYETSVLLFAKDAFVPFTNNRAERDIRMNKVKQKISGSFRSELYAKAYCRISSYLKTMHNQGINPMMALYEILTIAESK
jgi:transposase